MQEFFVGSILLQDAPALTSGNRIRIVFQFVLQLQFTCFPRADGEVDRLSPLASLERTKWSTVLAAIFHVYPAPFCPL